MNVFMFVVFLFFVWFLLVVVMPLLQMASKGKKGGVSIFPGLPFGPLAAWGIAALMNAVKEGFGYYAVGGVHVMLLLFMVGFSCKYLYEINCKKVKV